MPPDKIPLILVEDHPDLSTELEQWIHSTSGLQCLAVFPSGEETLAGFPDPPPSVALIDLRLPGMSGVELIRELRLRHPAVQCLVLTMYAESELIFEAIQAGACGYLLKRTPLPEIADAIRQVHAGGSVMTPRIARRVLEMFAAPPVSPAPLEDPVRHSTLRSPAGLPPTAADALRNAGPAGPEIPPPAMPGGLLPAGRPAAGEPAAATADSAMPPAVPGRPVLTVREIRVLQLMVQGRARKQITADLQINTHTLDYVIRCIYRKLHVQSLAGAVSIAVRDGLVG